MKKSMLFKTVASALFVFAGIVSCKTGEGTDYANELMVTPSSVNLVATAPSTVTISVATDAASWDVSAPADWFSATKSGNKVVIQAQNNTVKSQRSHTLTFSAPDAKNVEVKVTQAAFSEAPASLQGSQYIIYVLDEASRSIIGQDKILYDLSPDEIAKFFWYWEGGSAEPGVWSGPNFYGNVDGFIDVVNNTNLWGGGGFMIFEKATAGGVDILNTQDFDILNEDGWYFHMGVKGSPNATFSFTNPLGTKLIGGTEVPITVGAGTEYPLTMSEWTEIEIPVSDWLDHSWIPSTYAQRKNANDPNFVGLTFNFDTMIPGSELCFDAAFFYKK